MRKTPFLLLCSLAACGGGGSATTGPNVGTTNGTFTATIDGQAWVSNTNQTAGGSSAANAIPGTVTLIGTKTVSATSYTTITLALGYLSGPGTYPLGVNAGTTAGGSGIVFAVQGTSIGTWSTNLIGNAGTVTITSLTSTRIVGTFQFTAPPQSFTTTTGTRNVASGAFDLPLPANFTVAPATNKGSKITGTVGGAAWNAATVIAIGAGGALGISASTDSLSLSLVSGRAVAAGSTYPIGGISGGTGGSAPLAGAVMQIIKTGTSLGWTSGSGTSAVGSFTVATLSGNRATGSFSATLIGGAGTSGTLAVSGTFDVRVDNP
jgi:hypothetical protein